MTEGTHALAEAPPGCRLWLINLAAPLDAQAWLACSPPEHARASRFRFERDARRYRAAHAAMRPLLAQALGVEASSVQWREGPHGKPHLLGHPGWHFNLSHSGDWALLGLSQGRPIGVDIECPQRTMDLSDLAGAHFTAAEQAALTGLPSDQQLCAFLRTWSRKEACLKALGTGLSVAPHEVDTVSDHTHVHHLGQPCRMQVFSLPWPARATGLEAGAGPAGAQAAVALVHPSDTHLLS